MPETRSPGAAGRSVTVEFGDDCNRTISINTLKLRVRGRFSLQVLASRDVGARDVGQVMAQMPDIPGIRMKLTWGSRRYVLYDPLEKDKATLARINSARKRAMIGGDEFKPVEPTEGELDENEFKTLVIELVKKLGKEGGGHQCLTEHEGKLPKLADAMSMKGEKIYDPWNSGRKPRFESEVPEWMEKLDSRS